MSGRRGGLYLDTSALGRVLLREPDAVLIGRELARFDKHFSSLLLRVELRRLGYQKGVLAQVDGLLADVSLSPLDEPALNAAETVPPPSVATLDAIHLATALRLAGRGLVEAIMTYERRLAAAAGHHGLEVVAPA